jgi:hypothetical protein
VCVSVGEREQVCVCIKNDRTQRALDACFIPSQTPTSRLGGIRGGTHAGGRSRRGARVHGGRSGHGRRSDGGGAGVTLYKVVLVGVHGGHSAQGRRSDGGGAGVTLYKVVLVGRKDGDAKSLGVPESEHHMCEGLRVNQGGGRGAPLTRPQLAKGFGRSRKGGARRLTLPPPRMGRAEREGRRAPRPNQRGWVDVGGREREVFVGARSRSDVRLGYHRDTILTGVCASDGFCQNNSVVVIAGRSL